MNALVSVFTNPQDAHFWVFVAVAEHKRLVGVEVRPDGMIRLERETGWAVIDPAEVVAVVWNGDAENTPGQFL